MLNTERIEKIFELLKTEPNDIFLNYALGIEYITNPENYSLAEEQFKKVLLLNPEYIAVHYQLGKLFEAQAKNIEALEYYKTGLTKAKEQKNNKAIRKRIP